ncbi:SDR family NAD(P)-dependent oxidoreductase [Sinimarinibacterium sp. NLF-5-8]|uniref:SDR family NAD(P)-dependent oxidoreductase n=1 Tax=Sinimarinibacterium sp. NLF-5-8 TaxID=2698684 RepID=UPI00137C2BE2|nr:SDR family NAD(P)-dependent oxidoreductase [Sinimarinibacterium sp. NLF-5-8]QHS09944.1 SDR family NAD(P)-dependent oxidoreductase [Sinimarinibacterium sp. NLF-5-8]
MRELVDVTVDDVPAPAPPCGRSCLVVGAGPGIGRATALAFALQGYDVGLIARRHQRASQMAAELTQNTGRKVRAFEGDASSEPALRAAIDAAIAELGAPDVLVYNVASHEPGRPLAVPLDHVMANFQTNVVGALIAARAVAPAMIDCGRGSILFTGGGFAYAPAADYCSLSIDKAALRSLTYSLAQQLGAHGVHVATVTVHGFVQTGTQYDPSRIARAFVQLHKQPKGQFETEIIIK